MFIEHLFTFQMQYLKILFYTIAQIKCNDFYLQLSVCEYLK